MKLKINSFLLVMLGMCVNTLWYNNANAGHCDYAGWYRWDKWCMPCPKGCYCPKTADEMEKAPNQWMTCAEGLTKYGIYKCEDGYTTKEEKEINENLKKSYYQGATSYKECFFVASDTKNKVFDKDSACVQVQAGKYFKAGYENLQDCPDGYICPGKYMKDKKQTNYNSGIRKVVDWDSSAGLVDQKTICRVPNNDQGMYRCPSGTEANSNHTACESITQTIKCDPGKYLPAGKKSCTACKTDSRYYCPGGSLTSSKTSDVGLKQCPNNVKADSKHTKCLTTGIKCSAGQYLPKNASKCKTCKTGRYYVCEGGSFSQSESSDQGLKKCGSGYVANSTNSKCLSETGLIVVPAGQYLPANKLESVSCSSQSGNKFCPGGDFYKANKIQGVKPCPFDGHSNSEKTACVITLSKDQMKQGPDGDLSSCWAKSTEHDKYIKCMFGNDSRYYQ